MLNVPNLCDKKYANEIMKPNWAQYWSLMIKSNSKLTDYVRLIKNYISCNLYLRWQAKHLNTARIPKRNLTLHLDLIGTFVFPFITNSIRNQSDRSLINDLVNDPKLFGLLWSHEVICVHICLNDLNRLARMPGIQLIQRIPNSNNLLGMNRNILCLATKTTRRLVNHDCCIWKSSPLAPGTRSQ